MSTTAFLVLIGLTASSLSWLFSKVSRWLARSVGAVDQPTGGRKIHKNPTPLLGGVGVAATIFLFVIVGLIRGWFPATDIRPLQLVGFLVAIGILTVGGFLDDRFDLRPSRQWLFPFFASLVVLMTGTGILQVTKLVGHGGFSLVWWQQIVRLPGFEWRISLPSDILTLIWLMAVTYATKFLDGLDGLVTGQTVIGSGLIVILALSTAYFQLPVAILALIVGASFLGFLPSNVHPAKQFLGEAGSTLAGFSLGFLAIVSGAKVATALMALGVPLIDAALVVGGRILRGSSPVKGDNTHLHFRLLDAGLSQRKVVGILWMISLAFGLLAFEVQSRGKLFLLGILALLTFCLSLLAQMIRRKREKL